MEQLNITQEKENALFSRKEIQGFLSSEVAPSNDEVKKLLSEKYSVDTDSIKIKNIIGRFGSKEFKVSASIYPSKEDKDNVEIKSKKEIEAEKKVEEARLAAEKSNPEPEVKAKEESPVEKETEPKEEVKEKVVVPPENKEEVKEEVSQEKTKETKEEKTE